MHMSEKHMSTEGGYNKIYERLDRLTECMDEFRVELQKIGDYTHGLQLKSIFLPLLMQYDRIMQQNDLDENPKVRDFAKELYETLEYIGISKIDRVVGCSFDRKVHKIVTWEHGSGEEPDKVLKIVRDGYMLNDFVIRYQEVVIAAADDQEGGGVVSRNTVAPTAVSQFPPVVSPRDNGKDSTGHAQEVSDGLSVSSMHKSLDLGMGPSSELISSPTAHSSSPIDGVSTGQAPAVSRRSTGDQLTRANISKPDEVTRAVVRKNPKETQTLKHGARQDLRMGRMTTRPRYQIFRELLVDKIRSFGSWVWKLIRR